MFQDLIERFLFRSLESFVEGFNKSEMETELSKGKVSFSNLKLKPNLFTEPALPFRLAYSHIGLISLDVPWKKLSSESVEVIIEDVYATITPLESKCWEVLSEYDTKKRFREFEKLVHHYTNKVYSSMTPHLVEEEAPMKRLDEKMRSRASENSKITVKNLHVRIEDKENRKYSGGFTCEEIKIFTANEKGEPQFIDRTVLENSELPLRRVFAIKNIAPYWNADPNVLISENISQNPRDLMKQIIRREGQIPDPETNFVTVASFKLLTTKSKSGLQGPGLSLECDLKPLEIAATRAQRESFSCLLEFWNSFLKRKGEKYKDIATPETLESAEDSLKFSKLIKQLLERKKELRKLAKDPQQYIKVQDCLESIEIRNLYELLCLLPPTSHARAVKDAVEEFEKVERIRKFKKEKDSIVNKIFSLFNSDPVITSEEIRKIEQEIKERLGAPEKNPYGNFSKELTILTLCVRNEGVNVKYEEKDAVKLEKFQSDLSVLFKSDNQLFSRKEYGFITNVEFRSRDTSIADQYKKFDQELKRVSESVGDFIDLISSKMAKNTISSEDDAITNKISLNAIWL